MAPQVCAQLRDEVLAMRFIAALVHRGLQVKTAQNYFSAFQGWMAREYGVKRAGGRGSRNSRTSSDSASRFALPKKAPAASFGLQNSEAVFTIG